MEQSGHRNDSLLSFSSLFQAKRKSARYKLAGRRRALIKSMNALTLADRYWLVGQSRCKVVACDT